MSWVRESKRRRSREEELPVVRELVIDEPEQIPVVVWLKRCCPFCGNEDINDYGRSRDGSATYYLCRSIPCGKKFKVVYSRFLSEPR